MTLPDARDEAVITALDDVDPAGPDATGMAKAICEAFVDGLDVDGASLSLLTHVASRQTLWATDHTVQLIEDLQFGFGEGPCVEASATGRWVEMPDLRPDDAVARWPAFVRALLRQTDAVALFAFPMRWGNTSIGALDLYRTTSGSLGPASGEGVQRAADRAARLLLGLPNGPLNGDPTQLDRKEIHQATGMVVGQLGIDSSDALARLRAFAFRHERSLEDVARDVVALRLDINDDHG